MLLGNKADMAETRVIKREEGEKLARVRFYVTCPSHPKMKNLPSIHVYNMDDEG
jgi:hypothetical protein